MGGFSWSEILFILVVALVIFGPRKLPELGKMIGQAIGQFKRASEEFKRSWEDEVETEKERERVKATIPQAKETNVETITETAQIASNHEQDRREPEEHWM